MPDALPDWTRLFPDEDYQFHFGVRSGAPETFFGVTSRNDELLRERRRWLNTQPDQCRVQLPTATPLINETIALARQWRSLTGNDSPNDILELGRVWEPDFVLLRPDENGAFAMVAACVCFPSSWRVTDKIGRPLQAIHEPVPGLNTALGPAIDRYLSHLKPGAAALRSNWGLSRSPELNHHPDRRLPPIEPPLKPEEVFVRIENQALVALPESGGILFGIRLEIIPLPDLLQFPTATRGLHRALRTMPEDVARYKNLSKARGHLIDLLDRSL